MAFEIRLQKILTERGITLKELSLISGVSLNILDSIIKGTRKVDNDTLAQIADSLNVPPQYILGSDGYAPLWSDEEIAAFPDDFIDTNDGLLNEILKISQTLTTKGRIKCIDFLKSIQAENISNEYKVAEYKYLKRNQVRLGELSKMHDEGLLSDLEFQKLKLIITKKLYLPYFENDDILEQENNRLRSYVKEAEQRLSKDKIKPPFDQ